MTTGTAEEVTKILLNKDNWQQQVFWNPQDVADFLNTLTPFQAKSAKVVHWEVKIMVLYPNA